MKPPDAYFNSGPRLTITFAVLIALILGGNGLLIWQFHIARLQTDRLTGVNQQLVLVLRLQESLLSFHHRLDQLALSKDAHRLVTEGEMLRTTLLEQTERIKIDVTHLPSETRVNPDFLPTLEAIEITLGSQVKAITTLGTSEDWEAVRLRLSNELEPMEALTSALLKSIDQDVDVELFRSVANMSDVQRRILFLVPTTAICTLVIAIFFAWAIAHRIMELRAEERISERMRVARDLHDTLLQSFQGTLMKLHAVTYMLPDRSDAQTALEIVIDQARQAVIEGRDAVRGLRSSTLPGNDLAQTITQLGDDLAAHYGNSNCPEVQMQVEGTPRELAPILRDDIYSISGEAVRNAFLHSGATRVEVEIRYDAQQLRLRVRDNGKGIDPKVLESGTRDGHYGLPGMHERTKLVGGKLTVWSELDAGTQIELAIPASLAYAKSSSARWPTFQKKGA